MRLIRIKAARHIFAQLKKDGKIPADQLFSEDDVDVSDIKEGERYYSGFIFVSSLSPHYALFGRLSSTVTGHIARGKDISRTAHFSVFTVMTRIKTFVLSYAATPLEMRMGISG